MNWQEGAGNQELIFSAVNYQGYIAFILSFLAVAFWFHYRSVCWDIAGVSVNEHGEMQNMLFF